jgi:energy-coupling factor transporter ATP-binding protein EcfA2
MSPSIDAITVKAIGKRYASRHGPVTALDDVTFAVGEGEFVAVVGPSGCGKSTLLKILAGLLPATGGQALLRGTPIAGPRRDIGVVLDRAEEDRALHHPLDPGGRLPRRPRPRHDGAAGTTHGRRARGPRPPAPAGGDEHSGVRPPREGDPGPVQRERRPRRMTTTRNVTLSLVLLALSLLAWNIIKTKVESGDLITNELIDEVNRFDAARITAEAKAYKMP